MSEQYPIPKEGPFVIPCVVASEPGWRTIVRHENEVRLVAVVGWRLAPDIVHGNMFQLGTTPVLGCTPLVASEFGGARFLGVVFEPSADEAVVQKRLETYRGIYQTNETPEVDQ
jgi:hypothetical protein